MQKLDISENREIAITPEVFEAMLKLRDEFESLIETIEIMNDKKLMAGIKRSKADFEAGRATKIKIQIFKPAQSIIFSDNYGSKTF